METGIIDNIGQLQIVQGPMTFHLDRGRWMHKLSGDGAGADDGAGAGDGAGDGAENY